MKKIRCETYHDNEQINIKKENIIATQTGQSDFGSGELIEWITIWYVENL